MTNKYLEGYTNPVKDTETRKTRTGGCPFCHLGEKDEEGCETPEIIHCYLQCKVWHFLKHQLCLGIYHEETTLLYRGILSYINLPVI